MLGYSRADAGGVVQAKAEGSGSANSIAPTPARLLAGITVTATPAPTGTPRAFEHGTMFSLAPIGRDATSGDLDIPLSYFTFVSTNPSVVRADGYGQFTALARGKGEIVVSLDGREVRYPVQV
ncbi:hypothetical protein EON81_29000, partial [bacterium]